MHKEHLIIGAECCQQLTVFACEFATLLHLVLLIELLLSLSDELVPMRDEVLEKHLDKLHVTLRQWHECLLHTGIGQCLDVLEVDQKLLNNIYCLAIHLCI